MRWKTLCLALLCGLMFLKPPAARADDIPAPYRPAVKKGLEWLVKQQHRDGHWGANGGQYPVAMTALAGMALLMEGSTATKGPYAKNIRRAADWLMHRSQKGNNHHGLIANPDDPNEASRYIFGHGYAILFLASVYEEEEDRDRRQALKDVLNRAVQFTGAAQTTQGGWGYIAAKDGGNFDEGAATMTQVQALRVARNAGIPLPRATLARARTYLQKSTTARGGIVYSLSMGTNGGERPPLTAAAIVCAYGSGRERPRVVKQWLLYCKTAIPVSQSGRIGHDEFTHYYYAQAIYGLGEDGYAKLFPQSAAGERLTWSKYRKAVFDSLVSRQGKDGSWGGGPAWSVGPVYTTAVYLTIMQLDRNVLPIYQR